MAAVFAAGVGAMLSHLSAAVLLRIARYAPPIPDVLARRGHRPIEGIRFRTYRQFHPLDATKYHGIPVTTVARTLVDLTDDHTPEELANFIHEAAFRNRFSLTATRQAMHRANGRRNLHRLDEAINAHLAGSAGAKSRGEIAFLALLDQCGIPKPLVNTHVLDVEVDLHWPDVKLVVEVDGPGHERPQARREDEACDRVFRAAGYTVLRFAEDARPEDVIAALRDRLST